MDFEYSQEQQQFTDSIRRWAESNYDFESRKQIIYSDTGVSNKAWAAMAEAEGTGQCDVSMTWSSAAAALPVSPLRW